MKNKLKTLIILLLLSFTSLSQVDTNRICFSYDVVRAISIDLLKCDSISSELKYTENILKIVEIRSALKDETIELLLQKNINYGMVIGTYEQKEKIYKTREKELIEENTTLTRKNKNLKTGLMVSSTTTTILGGILAIFIIK